MRTALGKRDSNTMANSSDTTEEKQREGKEAARMMEMVEK